MNRSLPLLIVLFFFAVAVTAKGQILYSLVDTTDNISFTYESASFIESDLESVAATTANSDFNTLFFYVNRPWPVDGNPGAYFDVIYATNDSSGAYAYLFDTGTFENLGSGTYSSPPTIPPNPDPDPGAPDNPGSNLGCPSVMTITATPEPSSCFLLGVGMIAVMGNFLRRSYPFLRILRR